MALYYYDKYAVITTYGPGVWSYNITTAASTHLNILNGTTTRTFGTSYTEKASGTSQSAVLVLTNTYSNSGTAATVGHYYKYGYTLYRVLATNRHDVRAPVILNKTKGALNTAGIIAENGTYPTNGAHTDGYWYVRGALAASAPTITTDIATNVTYNSAQINGSVTATGGENPSRQFLIASEDDAGFVEKWDSQIYYTSQTTVNSNANGILSITSTGVDPMLHMYGVCNLDPNVYRYIIMKYKITAGAATNWEIFFCNNLYTAANAGQHIGGTMIADGNWHLAVIDGWTHANWKTQGNITGFRFDWATVSGATMETDFVGIYNSSALVTLGAGGVGSFNTTLFNLQESSRHYFQAFGSNTAGSSYGQLLDLTTLPKPVNLKCKVNNELKNITSMFCKVNGTWRLVSSILCKVDEGWRIAGTTKKPLNIPGLVSYHPLDGDVNDYSGNNYHATTVGTTYVSGLNQNALHHDNNMNSYINMSNIPFSQLSSCSISFWVKLDAVASWLPFIGQSTSIYIMATASSTGAFYHQTAGNPTAIYADAVVRATPIANTSWHHYVITGVNLSAWTTFKVNNYTGWTYAGSMQNLRIYNRILNATEVSEIYQKELNGI